MPTTARRRMFVPQAIDYFLRQDYANKELLVFDDGDESLAELVPNDPHLRYIRLEGGRTLGSKRNLCVEAARGDLIMHWDDDDWATPNRISYQVDALLSSSAEICGLRQMIFYELATGNAWLYEYPTRERAWLAGGSLLYTRDFWRAAPFSDVQVASDTTFVWNQKMDRAIALTDYSFYVAMIHPDNTSAKICQGSYWSKWDRAIESILGDDYAFYRRFLSNGEEDCVTPATVSEEVSSACGSGRVSLSPNSRSPSTSEAELPGLRPRPQMALTLMDRSLVQKQQFQNRAAGKPQLSCILATGNRAEFTRQAIRCFMRQTFDDAELIVVDDGAQSVADLCAGLFRVRHIRLDEPTTLGRKLNIGIEQAAGAVIQKLDDDDFYHQDFLARSFGELQSAPHERAVVTWDCFTILIAGEKPVHYSGHGWTTGGTLCFRRRLWEERPFRDEPNGVDASFIEDHRPQLVRVCAPELYMLVRHGRNTWKRLSNGVPVERHFESLPAYNKPLEELIEPIDTVFYRALVSSVSLVPSPSLAQKGVP